MKKSSLLLVVLLAAAATNQRAAAQNIYTFAGVAGPTGYSGDGGQAAVAKLAGPAGVAVDTAGNVYFADARNNVVRKVTTAGIISTFAGNGTGGYAGDGGAATAAVLRTPTSVAVDRAGNVYIADTRNNVVRRVSTTGIISTVAGNGTAGYSGDNGPATAAELSQPNGLAVDTSGKLYIADTRNNVVRMLTAGIITNVAGNHTAGYTGDGGAATAAELSRPLGISVNAAGALFIADARNNVVRMVSGGNIATFAGTGTAGHAGDGGPAAAALLYSPVDVKADALGNVYVADSSNTVRVINSTNIISDFAATGTAGYAGDGGAAILARMTGPDGLAIDRAHNVYIATQGNNVIRRVGAPVAGITITSNTGDTVCLGGFVHFTATAVGDTAPHYQWQENGINTGSDSAGFTPSLLTTGAVIRCYLTSASTGGTNLALSISITLDSLARTGTITGSPSFCVGSTTTLRDMGGAAMGTWVSSNTAVATMGMPPGTLTALTPGTDSIFYVLTNICGTDKAALAITVGANNIGAISGPKDVCIGTPVTYTDTTGAGQWAARPGTAGTMNATTGTFTPNRPGPAVIIFSTSPGCYVVDSIMVDPTPRVGPISGPTTVDTATTITLTDPAPGGTWSSSNPSIATVGSGTGVVTGVNAGVVTITYTITTPGGCTADTTYTVDVINTTGIGNMGNNPSFSIFPNPASGTLNIAWANQFAGKGTITISDLAGRAVYTSAIEINTNGQSHLNIFSLNAGIYIITIKSGNGFYRGKLAVGE